MRNDSCPFANRNRGKFRRVKNVHSVARKSVRQTHRSSIHCRRDGFRIAGTRRTDTSAFQTSAGYEVMTVNECGRSSERFRSSNALHKCLVYRPTPRFRDAGLSTGRTSIAIFIAAVCRPRISDLTARICSQSMDMGVNWVHGLTSLSRPTITAQTVTKTKKTRSTRRG